MNPADNDIERNVKDIKFETSSDLDARILSDALTALESSDAPNGPDESIRRINMKNYIPLLATAAAAVIVMAVGIVQFNSNPTDKNENPIIALNPDSHINKSEPIGTDSKKTTDTDLVPVKIEYPEAVFVGTPDNLSSIPNIEPKKPEGHIRLPIMAPMGTVNVALGKSVTGTDEDPITGDLSYFTDGDKEAQDGSYAEFAPGKQYYTVDLEAKHNIYGIMLWHYHKTGRVYFDIIVQTADDPDFIDNVHILFNNDIDNTFGLGAGTDMNYVEESKGKMIDGKGVQGRYVRFYSNGNNDSDLNHYIEIEVYGTPIR